MKAPTLIAEIGCNHKGQIDIAKEMIFMASTFAKCEFAKFQKRSVKELLSKDEYNAPHPNPMHSYGDSYGAHREFLELSLAQHFELKKHCENNRIGYSSSVWDLTSAKEIASLNPSFIKVPSAINRQKNILKYLCHDYEGDIHISLGMTTRDEEEEIISFFEDEKRNHNLVIYSCTSGYPVAFEDICLLELSRIREKYLLPKRVKALGFSGHHLGIAADVAAMTLGAEYIERHFTLDRTWKGTDHAASLEPDGLRRLSRDLKNVAKALEFKKEDILEVEKLQREKLKKNQIKW